METMGSVLTGTRCTIEPGSGNYHFRLTGCDDCTVRDLARRSLGDVEDLYHSGHVTQPVFEAYMHVWVTSAHRFGSYADWQTPPTDPEVIGLVRLFRATLPPRQGGTAMLHTSPDGRRAVITGTADVATLEALRAAALDGRPHGVAAITPDGQGRLWAARTRAEARQIVTGYKRNGGDAQYVPPQRITSS